MQTIRNKPPSSGSGPDGGEPPEQGLGKDLFPLLTGVAVAVAAVGAVLALTDTASPLRGPFTLFFLLAAPAAAVGTALRGLDPFGRIVTSVAAAVALDLLVAQGMLATHRWSVRGGVVTVTVISSLILLLVLLPVRRRRGRTARRRTS
ncbi:hypothetical protein ACKI1I_09310 [Streptomyces turgidiscabies]|uniref:Uncharacterized protein n=1 Tax=Streptomyces turgidiscabies (strain Car8) TaxID=698760 RepID=L7EWE6_STRT8|nr:MULTISPECIES: hypothetical protein [Streptomyces]ELP62710.1 hypothetical protein STRTUCAR8_02546 [Streptomyces turgidiscabies Car8]MDX3493622.1 hypothetical protein [Streptomyces turgidiscabies]GAQ71785.1 hypothetical protein T45_03529 [Streptomyces turgidiscabies]